MRVPGAELASAFAAVAPAMSTEISRPHLCGAALWVDRIGARLMASDTAIVLHARLPGAQIACADRGVENGVVIPATTVRMPPDAAGEVTGSASNSRPCADRAREADGTRDEAGRLMPTALSLLLLAHVVGQAVPCLVARAWGWR